MDRGKYLLALDAMGVIYTMGDDLRKIFLILMRRPRLG